MADDKKIIFSLLGLSKIYPPQKQVLKNIYLSFYYVAKICIIGLNGSGKSTLLKIIAGLEKDYQGEVVFSPGYSVGHLDQDPQLTPGKTVKEIVQEGGAVNFLLNVLWFFFGGVQIAIGHLIFGVFFCITIIGIPFGKQHFKLAKLAHSPFGSRIVRK
jgi:ABC-type arginine transport system ATPase subunit